MGKNFPKIPKAAEQSLTPALLLPGDVWEVRAALPVGQPESPALSSWGVAIREPAPQAGQVQPREWAVALLRQQHRQG